MALSISAADKLRFSFTRTGGAKMTLRIAVFKDPLTPQQQRVKLLFMGASTQITESRLLAALGPGSYQVVAVNIIEEALNGTYDYSVSLNGQTFAAKNGDVNTSPGLDVEPVVHRENLAVS